MGYVLTHVLFCFGTESSNVIADDTEQRHTARARNHVCIAASSSQIGERFPANLSHGCLVLIPYFRIKRQETSLFHPVVVVLTIPNLRCVVTNGTDVRITVVIFRSTKLVVRSTELTDFRSVREPVFTFRCSTNRTHGTTRG